MASSEDYRGAIREAIDLMDATGKTPKQLLNDAETELAYAISYADIDIEVMRECISEMTSEQKVELIQELKNQ